jgi:hypothetical protein
MATQKRIATGAGHDDFEDLDSSNAIHSVAEYGLRSTTLAFLDKELARTRNDLERTVLSVPGWIACTSSCASPIRCVCADLPSEP